MKFDYQKIKPIELPSYDLYIEEMTRMIIQQRDEIIVAFIAKYDCEPDECIQVCDHKGSWYVRRKTVQELQRDYSRSVPHGWGAD